MHFRFELAKQKGEIERRRCILPKIIKLGNDSRPQSSQGKTLRRTTPAHAMFVFGSVVVV